MKKIFLILVFLPAIITGFSQDIVKVSKAHQEIEALKDSTKRWFINGTGSANFSQASFTNWAAGGENAMGFNASVNLKANYANGRHAWGNTVGLGYGFNIQGNDEKMFKKTNDRIELTSAYGFKFSNDTANKWLLTVLINFRTQFAPGYNYPNDSVILSKFMAPGYLVAGVGATYAPRKWFYLYMSPASGRFTFVMDDTLSAQGAFGVEKGKNIRGELGPYVRFDMNKDFGKSFNLMTTMELYTDYLKDFGNIDVNWYLQFNMKVNKWLAASITTQLIYDNDVNITDKDGKIGPRTQFKEILGVGLTYSFN